LEDKIERKILVNCPKKANCTHSRRGILLSNIVRYSRQPEKIKDIIGDVYKHGQILVGKNFSKSGFCSKLLNETVVKLDGSVYHGMLLLLFYMPQPAMEEYVSLYLNKAIGAVPKKNSLFFDILNILLYKSGAGPLSEVMDLCGKERFEGLQNMIKSVFPQSYAKVFSEKLDSTLQTAAAAKKNTALLRLFEEISAAAKIEYDRRPAGGIFGNILKLFGDGK
jgi:hypothetical protein